MTPRKACHQRRVVYACAAELVEIVIAVHLGVELLRKCGKTNFAGPISHLTGRCRLVPIMVKDFDSRVIATYKSFAPSASASRITACSYSSPFTSNVVPISFLWPIGLPVCLISR